MKKIKVGVAALNQTPLDWQGNVERIQRAIHRAKTEGVQILTLPELTLTGYGCEDAFLAPATANRSLEALAQLLPHSQKMILSVGLPVWHNGVLLNCVAVLCDGEWVGLIPKKFLPGEGVHYEPRWFKEWPVGQADHFVVDLGQGEIQIPMGDLFFEWNGVRFGFEICEEAWVAQRPGNRLAKESIDFIFNPSASHFAFGKNEIRKGLVLEGSRAFSCCYVYANLVGNEAGRIIYDGSLFIAQEGQMIAQSQRFSFEEVQLLTKTVEIQKNPRRPLPSTALSTTTLSASFPEADAVPSLLTKVSLRGFNIPSCPLTPGTESSEMSEQIALPAPLTKHEEFEMAVRLGLFDYLRKSHSKGFAISLSGGIDSSVVAVLAVSALKGAVQELGLVRVKQKLSFLPDLEKISTLEELLKATIHGAYQSTRFSSEHTHDAAKNLAHALGVTFSEWSVEPMKALYEEELEKVLGRPLDWKTDDLALQNIQARVRAPGIWLLANIKGYLLLATSNRSEAAVGYATMDGDTAGGLSPIAGVDKYYLGEWVRWKSQTSTKTLDAIPALKTIYAIPPTAELRPLSSQQTDESDLMPYAVLDRIERLLLVNRMSPLDILPRITQEFSEYSRLQLRDWLVRFLKLWTQNQWKRERFAPGFHLDVVSLDPKTWCRFPILSKAYLEDIEKLKELQ